MFERRPFTALNSTVLLALCAACSSPLKSGAPDGGTGTGGTTVAPGTAGATGSSGTGGASQPSSSAGGSGGNAFASSECNPPATVQCTGVAPSSALITDFSSGSVFGAWGASLFGGTYVYPGLPRTSADCGPVTSYPMTETKSNGVWNITGTVGSYSGMGLWWMCRSAAGGTDYASSCLVDASAFTGISFVVSGDAGPKGSIAVHLATPSTMRPTVDYLGNPSNCGTCTSATCGIDVPIPVTATPTTVSLTWAELGVTKPDAIAMILFVLPDPCNYSTGRCVATPYAANIILDDIKLTN